MKVCLISPPTVTEFNERQFAESEALRLIAQHAPAGILSLAAVLEERSVIPHLIDLNRLYYEYINLGLQNTDGGDLSSYVTRHLEGTDFDVFGLGTVCSTYPLTLRLAEALRLTHPEATIILGGPQASVVDVPTIKSFPFVDFVVRGEAEETLPLLLDAVSGRGDGVKHIRGITYRNGSEVLRNPNAPVITDLDSLPLPAFHLYPHIRDCSYAPLEAGRGCPFACSFCSTNDFFRRRYRMKSPHVLVQQMNLVRERYGINSFDLIHDMFTVDRKKVVAFCEAVEGSEQQFCWTCSARTDCVDDKLLSIMARAGCRGVFFGVDTGSEQMQQNINKGLSIREALLRIGHASRSKMNTTVSLITGFPEETKDNLRATVRFFGESLRFQRTDVQFHLLAPLAETPITTLYKEQLVYDEIFSDMSFQGWEQAPEDRAMIVAHRDIFTNFYSVPTRWLDRHYLKELREFLLRGAANHRSLMLLLHYDMGDLLQVFDEWNSWHSVSQGGRPAEGRTRNYYLSACFSHDLLDFIRIHYLRKVSRYPHLVMSIAKVEEALLSFGELPAQGKQGPTPRRARKTTAFEMDAMPNVSNDARLVHVDANYKRLMRCLKRKERLEDLPLEKGALLLLRSGENIKVLQLNKLTDQLLCLCDGSRSLKDVVDRFSSTDKIDGVPMVKAGWYGLASLFRQGVIDIKAASN